MQGKYLHMHLLNSLTIKRPLFWLMQPYGQSNNTHPRGPGQSFGAWDTPDAMHVCHAPAGMSGAGLPGSDTPGCDQARPAQAGTDRARARGRYGRFNWGARTYGLWERWKRGVNELFFQRLVDVKARVIWKSYAPTHFGGVTGTFTMARAPSCAATSRSGALTNQLRGVQTAQHASPCCTTQRRRP